MRRRLILALCIPVMASLAGCAPPAPDATVNPAPSDRLLERQAAVRQAIHDPNVAVSNDGTNVTVVFPAALLFGTSAVALSPLGQADLGRLAAHLRAALPGSAVIVVGHTDSSGSASDDQALSEQRARVVAQTLVAGGVPHQRIKALGQGAARPLASDATPNGRTLNRRVEIIIRPGA